MKKRGFVIGWQNRHWIGSYSAYAAGGSSPDIPSGGTGTLPDFLTFTIKGTGYDYYYDSDDDRIRYDSEKCFVSPVFLSSSGDTFRFCVLYTRSSHTAQDCTCYFCIVKCSPDGKISGSGGGSNSWDSAISGNGIRGNAFMLWRGAAASKWDTIISEIPYIEIDAYNMMIGAAEPMYNNVSRETPEGDIVTELLHMDIFARTFWTKEPLFWSTPETGLNEIVARAKSLSGYKYWYGGDGRVATESFANSLKNSYPSVWTNSYYSKALGDIGQRVADCSYLVNYAYGIASPGNHGPGTSNYLSRWSRWSGTPKNGMITWRNGHTGIYNNGKTIEMVGIDYDYQEKTYNASKWSAILYDPNRKY